MYRCIMIVLKNIFPFKKKTKKLTSEELRDLRRLITFMVINGFSLSDLRKLYLDELYDYHEHLFYNLERVGKIKDGTYDAIVRGKSKGVSVEDTVNQLRKQMYKTIEKK